MTNALAQRCRDRQGPPGRRAVLRWGGCAADSAGSSWRWAFVLVVEAVSGCECV